MARTLTTQQEAYLTQASRSVHLKVSLLDTNTGTVWQDMTDLSGLDWVESADISDNPDNTAATAKVVLFADFFETNNLTISPLRTDSTAFGANHSIAAGVFIKIEAAVMPEGFEPSASDWVNEFEGVIDSYTINNHRISLQCRDYAALLMDYSFIQDQSVEGSTGGTAVQTVMQSIITANENTPVNPIGIHPFTLYTPTSPSWVITEYRQDKMPVMEALRKLADQIGWVVKMKWDNGTSVWRLTFYAPDRSPSAADWTFDQDFYTNISKVAVNVADIRNSVAVVYTDGGGLNDRATITRTDSSSITKYGRRHMEISEASTSQIDSSSEAQTLADNILSDLAEPNITLDLLMPYHSGVELGDWIQIDPNEMFTAAQQAAVRSKKLSFKNGTGTTSLTLKGKATSGERRIYNREATPGKNMTADFIGPVSDNDKNKPSMFSLENGLASLHLVPNKNESLVPNTNFEEQSREKTLFPPDSWEVTAGVWGSADNIYLSAASQSGSQSLIFRDDSASSTIHKIQGELFPVFEGLPYAFKFTYWGDSSNLADHYGDVYIDYYQGDKTTLISSANLWPGFGAGSAWKVSPIRYFVPPTNARYIRLRIEKTLATTNDFNLYIDSVVVSRSKAFFRRPTTTTNLIPTGIWTSINFGAGVIRGMSLSNPQITLTDPGLYFIQADFIANFMNWAAAPQFRFQGPGGRVFIPQVGGGTVGGFNQHITMFDIIDVSTAGQTLDFQIQHFEAGTISLSGQGFMNIYQLESYT